MTWREGHANWSEIQPTLKLDTYSVGFVMEQERKAFLAGAKWAIAEIRKDIENRAGCDCFDDVQSLQVDLEEL